MPFYRSLAYEDNRDFAPRTIDRLVALREQLRTEIPARTLRDTLLLATWNIRDFDSNKFGQGPRLDESYYYIAEVIAAFDLVYRFIKLYPSQAVSSASNFLQR